MCVLFAMASVVRCNVAGLCAELGGENSFPPPRNLHMILISPATKSCDLVPTMFSGLTGRAKLCTRLRDTTGREG